jgi:hypothetical protein
MQRKGKKWLLRFSSILANVGKGDFVLRATREKGGVWHVEQDIQYSKGGAKATPVPARVVWGGDGHHHWHIRRIAAVRLVPFGANGKVAFTKKARIDAKIGFCFYDYNQLLGGPAKRVYSRFLCGHTRHDTRIGMGLSVGWVDEYPWFLVGQSIDVTTAPDGKYRLYATVDDQHWFREVTRADNMSWADIELSTKANGARAARVVNPGPAIHPPR